MMMERLMHVITHQRPSGTPPSPHVAISALHEVTHRVFRRNNRNMTRAQADALRLTCESNNTLKGHGGFSSNFAGEVAFIEP